MKVLPPEFIELAQNTPVLDVRSPGEYEKGHFPSAISFPLFTNNERAEIGTMYKQIGQQPAFERGLEVVGPKIKEMVVQAKALAREGRLLVHCWRGGMRSESVGNLLAMSGLKVNVLKGGYKAYRNWALQQFDKVYDLRIVGGMTGSNKTGVLHELKAAGNSTIDLEGLADHKGSSFGALGSTKTVTQAQFENELALELHQNAGTSIWLEDESRKIGTITIPGTLWGQMRTAPYFFLDPPKTERIAHLVNGYGNFDQAKLKDAIVRITNRLGGLRTKEAIELLESNQLPALVDHLLGYYDKAYRNMMQNRSSKIRLEVNSTVPKPKETAAELLRLNTLHTYPVS